MSTANVYPLLRYEARLYELVPQRPTILASGPSVPTENLKSI